eukprot:TRINITY_DN5922_c0_g1_i1.p1 TRINITY_DN5922_c0_g1~~TRINITY_DN5922_c0_g1_i1.p1  ORF type:complete len:356 (-),score=45.74 TRINITY_DN5922_c0_g1_i1:37-1104(-)
MVLRKELATFLFSCLCLVIAQDDSCIATPRETSCQNYQMPESYSQAAVEGVCDMMSAMPACTVATVCTNTKYASGPFCDPFSIVKELCSDMTTMSLCSNFTSMCPSTSLITQCATETLPLPSSYEIQGLINGICSEMSMEACKACNAPSDAMDCPTLQIYSNLCKAMPSMTQCASWKMICSVVPEWPICSMSPTDEGFIPMMQMYLHTNIEDYILFKGWVPTTIGQFIGTLAAVCFFGIVSEGLKFFRCWCDNKWKYKAVKTEESDFTMSITDDVQTRKTWLSRWRSVPFRPKVDFLRSAFRTLEVFWSVMIMLVVMSFNVGIIVALCVGTFIGSLIFGRFADSDKEKSSDCCEM